MNTYQVTWSEVVRCSAIVQAESEPAAHQSWIDGDHKVFSEEIEVFYQGVQVGEALEQLNRAEAWVAGAIRSAEHGAPGLRGPLIEISESLALAKDQLVTLRRDGAPKWNTVEVAS